GTISTKLPRSRCSSPAGERIVRLKAPPTCGSTTASVTVKVSGANQRMMCSAALQARNTVSRRAYRTRDRRSGGNCSAGSTPALRVWGIVFSLVIEGFQVVAEAVESLLPVEPAGIDPALGKAEGVRLDRAGAYPADFFRLHQSGGFENA